MGRYLIQLLAGISLCVLLATSSQASAGEAEYYDWSGAYIGVHGGYVETKPKWADCCENPGMIQIPFESLSGSSAIFGLQGGYSWQFANAVLGIEGNFSKADVTTSADRTDFFAAGATEFGWMADVTARAGYAIGPGLLYAKGGVAFAGVKNYWTFGGADPFKQTQARGNDNPVGWTLGLGAEYGFTKHVSARVEYDYYDFGKSDRQLDYLYVDGGVPSERRLTAQAVKVGINYRF